MLVAVCHLTQAAVVRKDPQLGNRLPQTGLGKRGYISQLMVDAGGSIPLWTVPPLGWWCWALKENRPSKPVSEQCSSLASASTASRCPPWLTSVMDLQATRWSQPFPSPCWFWEWYFITTTETLTKTIRLYWKPLEKKTQERQSTPNRRK